MARCIGRYERENLAMAESMRKIISDHDIMTSNNLDVLSLVELISIVIKYSTKCSTEIDQKIIKDSDSLTNIDRRIISVSLPTLH